MTIKQNKERFERVQKALGTTDDLLDAIEGIQATIKGDEMGVFQLMLVETLKLRLEIRHEGQEWATMNSIDAKNKKYEAALKNFQDQKK